VIGKAIDARSDIFSLGVVLYEALTGVAPFDGDNVNAIMYATVNTTPPAPSSHNKLLPPMLDLIAAKAMAKLLEDRYQTIKEFGDDLREVRRQMDASRPAAALKATTSPPGPPRQSAPIIPPERMVDTATIPLSPDASVKEDDTGKALALSKTFDSFDATLRLAAMTDQTEDFRDYISATQKMRAYKGKIEAGSPLMPKPAPTPAPSPAPAPAPPPPEPEPPKPKPVARPAPAPVAAAPREESRSSGSSVMSNLVAVAAIVVLSVAALALAVALLLK
jgi:eukaryotic-like serine/threonine-protein kinase